MSDFTVISDTNPLCTELDRLKRERDALAEALQEMLDHVEWRRRSKNETAGPKDCTHRARAALAQVRK